MSGFPNMFMLLGPHSPLINVPVHTSAELQADYVVRAVELLARPDVVSIAPTRAAMDAWRREIRDGMGNTVWAEGCQSWYIGPDGVAVQWPFTRRRFVEMLRDLDFADYEIRTAPTEPDRSAPDPEPALPSG